MTIKKIMIKNIKGISEKVFNFDIIPNKPHIFVAPNGFGKSSIATAFASMNTSRIELDDDYYYENNPHNTPYIELEYNNGSKNLTLSATKLSDSNTISKHFDIHVVNSHLKANAVTQNRVKFHTTKANLEIKKIVLFKKIPEKVKVEYKISEIKSAFGKNNKVLDNISDILNNKSMMCTIYNSVDWKKFSKKKATSLIEGLLAEINEQEGSKEELLQYIATRMMFAFQDLSELKTIVDIILLHYPCFSKESCYLAAWQIYKIQSSCTTFPSTIKYYQYEIEKNKYSEIIQKYNLTWKDINIKKEKRELFVEFPKAHLISNGERDFLTFIILLMRAEILFKNNRECILVIDEIFDYLDDANIIAFQYHITQMIKRFKGNNRKIYIILLTHLDPIYFKHFCFNKHKLKIYYLDNRSHHPDSNILNLIKKRDHPTIKADIDKYFFHYHPESKILTKEFNELGIKKELSESSNFYSILTKHGKNYLTGENFDPYAIVAALRIKIEKLCYNRLPSEELKEKFITAHGTSNKIEVLQQECIDIPDEFFFLAFIYNTELHVKEQHDTQSALVMKLSHLTIKNIIENVITMQSIE